MILHNSLSTSSAHCSFGCRGGRRPNLLAPRLQLLQPGRLVAMGTYLEDYLESMYLLPSEIKRNFDLMRELDKVRPVCLFKFERGG